MTSTDRIAMPHVVPGESELPPVSITRFSGALGTSIWRSRPGRDRRSRFLVLEGRSGTVKFRSSTAQFSAPALLWHPSETGSEIEVEAGAHGYVLSISDDALTRTVASSAEAMALRRSIDRFLLLTGEEAAGILQPVASSCHALLAETQSPGRGSTTLMSAHLLIVCLHLWRALSQQDGDAASSHRGEGPRLLGNFLQLVELHYRDSWPVTRYASALGVTEDRLHAHCKRERGCGPRMLIHQRLIQEACNRLTQLDLPVEQIAYGLGFRDAAYFNRFFRKYQNTSPGAFRRKMRLEHEKMQPTYAAWP